MSEKILWNKLRKGHRDALEIIYRTYFTDLYNYGKKYSINESTVEDCIQELFVELWNRREKLSETDSIKPYLYVSLKRKIFHTTKSIRKITDNEVEEKHFNAVLAIDEILILNEANTKEKEKLNRAFKELSSRQKEILYLKYYSGMDYEEISQVMDLNYQSARNLVSRAIMKLSKHMLIVVTFIQVLWLK